MSIQVVFDKHAAEYDLARKKLIPCFDDFYQTAIREIPFSKEEKIDVLDLGAGTGLMAKLVASKFLNARIVLMDIAEKMLSKAKENLECFENDFEFIVKDYAKIESFEKNFNLIISSLSIHHLPSIEKQNLFRTIYAHLKPGGIFINADQVLGETEETEHLYRQRWNEQVREKGVSEQELNAALERMKEDKMSTLAEQTEWLKEAGFVNVTCWYKNYSFVVFSGMKASTK